MGKRIKTLSNNDGMTLMEVMVAVLIFSVFITAFMTGQGNNILSSARMKEDLLLKDLAHMQYNLTLLDPPDFSREIKDIKTETKAFKDYPGFEYTLSYVPVFIPDVEKILGTSEEDRNDPNRAMRKQIMLEFKENMERLIWQISIVVRNKQTQGSFEVSGWLYNPEANVRFTRF